MSQLTRKRYSLKDVEELINLSGSILLSGEFEGYNKHHTLKCRNCQQEWSASLRQIKNGRNCPYCSNLRKTIDSVREIGAKKEFILLSTAYKSMDAKYEWQCKDGHTFWRSANHMKRKGRKCPHCYFFLTEEKCRFILESLTGCQFLKTRKILDGLELDGYCEKLNLAFEYNGRQHYSKSSLFSADFDDIRRRDQIKVSRCETLDIQLIVIPYTESENLDAYIKNKMERFGVDYSGNIDWNDFDKYQPKKLEQLKDLLAQQNIRCLSQTYLGCDTKIDLECLTCGNAWKNSPEVLSRGVGCPYCKHNMWTSKQAHQHCSSKLVKLLDKYTLKGKKYRFQCNLCQYTWTTTMSCLIRSHGCAKCPDRAC